MAIHTRYRRFQRIRAEAGMRAKKWPISRQFHRVRTLLCRETDQGQALELWMPSLQGTNLPLAAFLHMPVAARMALACPRPCGRLATRRHWLRSGHWGRRKRQRLHGSVAMAVTRWLALAYPGQSIEQLSRTQAAAPMRLTLGRNPVHRCAAMTLRAAALVCKRRLRVSKAHALRHTFALEMERAGAPVSLIQQKLGHSSLAITGRYLSKLTSSANPYAEQLEIALGIV